MHGTDECCIWHAEETFQTTGMRCKQQSAGPETDLMLCILDVTSECALQQAMGRMDMTISQPGVKSNCFLDCSINSVYIYV